MKYLHVTSLNIPDATEYTLIYLLFLLIYYSIFDEIVYNLEVGVFQTDSRSIHSCTTLATVVYAPWLVDWDIFNSKISIDQSECIHYLFKGSLWVYWPGNTTHSYTTHQYWHLPWPSFPCGAFDNGTTSNRQKLPMEPGLNSLTYKSDL